MKKLFVILGLLANTGAFAQALSAEQKRAAVQRVDSLVSNYIRYSTFLAPGKNTITQEAISAFAGLFTPDAQIPDDVHPSYFYMDMSQEKLSGYWDYLRKSAATDRIVTVPVREFLRKIETLHKEGFVVRLQNATVSYRDLSGHNVKVLLAKSLQSFYNNELILETRDTLALNIRLSDDFSAGAISGIDLAGYSLKFVNDDDHDYVTNKNDKCPGEKGYFSPTGCPTEREKSLVAERNAFVQDSIRKRLELIRAITKCRQDSTERTNYMARIARLTAANPQWWVSGGLMVGQGNFSGTLRNTSSSYQQVNSDSFHTPGLTYKAGSYFGGFIQVERYFGATANFGIGTGVAFSSMKATLSAESFRAQFKATSTIGSRNFDYRQIITSNAPFEEQAKVTNVSIPILLIYKGHISKKLGFRIEGGVMVNMSAQTTMESTTGSFDYEAVYRFTGDNQSVYSATTGANDWLITRDFISLYNSHDVTGQFEALKDYGVALNYKPGESQQNRTSDLKAGIGILVRPAITYKINEDFGLNLGFFYSTTSMSGAGGSYQLMNERKQYNTLLNGYDKLKVSNYGVSLSFTHSLFYPRARWKRELEEHKRNPIKGCGQMPK
ncbi:MAG: hypothetical protein EOO16_09450 [Chitinophagaceae bacterium]|nr:MAG: hypothetical protein EOO16_09450 [Chitinophagaceae bacterium]